jgi:WD40 repeat protein
LHLISEVCLMKKRAYERVPRVLAPFTFGALLLLSFGQPAATESSPANEENRAGGPRQLVVQLGHSEDIETAIFSPDGRFVASASDDETAILWETSTGREIRRFPRFKLSLGALAFSPDARVLAAADGSGPHSDADAATREDSQYSVRLFDVSSGELVKEVARRAYWINSVSFSPDGQSLLTGSTDGMAGLWRVSDGELLRSFTAGKTDVEDAVFSADGKYIAVGKRLDRDSMMDAQTVFTADAYVFEIETGRVVRHFRHEESDASFHGVGNVLFSPDGEYLTTSSILSINNYETGTIRVWSLHDGKLTHSVPGRGPLAFSPDGRYLLADVGTNDEVKIYEIDGVEIFDLRERKIVRRISGFDLASQARDVSFSPDGESVLLALGQSNGGGASGPMIGEQSIRLYSASTGREIRSFGGKAKPVRQLSVSESRQLILAGDYLWDVGSGTRVGLENFAAAPLHKPTQHGQSVRIFSCDSTLVAMKVSTPAESIEETKEGLYVWNVETGEEVQKIVRPEMFGLKSAQFTVDNKFILTESLWTGVCLWQLAGAEKLWCRDIDLDKYSNASLGNVGQDSGFSALSPDGRFTLVRTSVDNLILLNNLTRRQLWAMKLGSVGAPGIFFSSDGKHFIIEDFEGTEEGTYLAFYDVLTRRLVKKQRLDEKAVVTESGERLASGLWVDVATGLPVAKPSRVTGWSGSFAKLRVFSSNGKLALGFDYWSGGPPEVSLYDSASGAKLRVFRGHEGGVTAASFFRGEEFVVTSGADGTTRIWKTETGEELCRLISFDDGTWVVVRPDGRFDTNNLDGIEGIYWRIPESPLAPLPLEVFMRDYYEPRLIARTLAGEQFQPVRDLSHLNLTQPIINIDGFTPANDNLVRVAVSVSNVRSGVQRDSQGQPLASGVYDVRLFRDGQLVGYGPEQSGAVTLDAGATKTFNFEVRLPRTGRAEQVEFTAYAFNADRVKSSTARRVFEKRAEPTAARGRAYLLSIGVSDNENAEYRLSFAADDARLFGETLAERLRATGRFIEVINIPLLSDPALVRAAMAAGRPTKRAIQGVLNLLSGSGKKVPAEVLREIPNAERLRAARPEDAVIIFFAGHGVTANGETSKGIFYLYPYDLGSGGAAGDNLRRAVSSEELSEWLKKVDAGEMLMVIDACHSAAAVEGQDFKPGPMGSRGLGQLSYDKGMRILTATQAADVAVEDETLKQGVLTYALVRDGLLRFGADYRPSDGRINSSEWIEYAARRVPEIFGEVKIGRRRLVVRGRPLDGTGAADYLSREARRTAGAQQPAVFDFSRGRPPMIISIKE